MEPLSRTYQRLEQAGRETEAAQDRAARALLEQADDADLVLYLRTGERYAAAAPDGPARSRVVRHLEIARQERRRREPARHAITTNR